MIDNTNSTTFIRRRFTRDIDLACEVTEAEIREAIFAQNNSKSDGNGLLVLLCFFFLVLWD